MSAKAPSAQSLYVHTARPNWGLALFAYERGDVRAYQFEDGKLREFQEGFYAKIQPAVGLEDRERATRRAALKRLLSKAGVTSRAAPRKTRATKKQAAGKQTKAAIPFAKQLALFGELFPEGFADPAWVDAHRGAGAARALKRHRDLVVAAAQKELAQADLEQLCAAENYDAALDRLQRVFELTDLVSGKHRKALAQLSPERRPRAARGLLHLLWSDAPYAARLAEWIGALGEDASWCLATAPSAFVHPGAHLFVSSTVQREQSRSLAPGLKATNEASALLYQRHRALGLSVREKLEEAGRAPRDLLDVFDFMKTTLSRKHRARLEAADEADASAKDAA
ncbi:MAG: hypothetical protein R3F62_27685 [Planctomycetota bacterium]